METVKISLYKGKVIFMNIMTDTCRYMYRYTGRMQWKYRVVFRSVLNTCFLV